MKKKLQPAITLLQQYMAQDMTVYAGHATLFLLTAFFPLLMWLLVVVNTLPGFTVDSVVELFFRFLPDLPVIRDTIAGLITSMNENSNTFVASLAVITTLVSASSGMAAIQKGLQKLTPGSRRTMLDRLWAVVYTFAFLWLLLIVLFCQNLSPLLHWALSLLPWLSQSHLFLRLHSLVSFSALAAFGLSILTFVLIYTFVPGGRRRMRDQLPGALFTAGHPVPECQHQRDVPGRGRQWHARLQPPQRLTRAARRVTLDTTLCIYSLIRKVGENHENGTSYCASCPGYGDRYRHHLAGHCHLQAIPPGQ